jgi:hypothetical protein
MSIDENAYARIARYVESAYPGAREVSSIRGVTRPRTFELTDRGHTRFLLTFVVDRLSSITHRCIDAHEAGDGWLVTAPERSEVFEATLDADLLARLKAAEPDRDNGSHHVSPEALDEGRLIVRTRSGPIQVPVKRTTTSTVFAMPAGQFWSHCARLLEIYPSHPPTLSRDADAFTLIRQLEDGLGNLVRALVPNPHWQVAASVGQGRWAEVPWCAVFDDRETTTAQKGVYPVIHFLLEGLPGLRIGLGVSYTEFKNRMAARSREVAQQLTDEEWKAILSRTFTKTTEEDDSPPVLLAGRP